MKPPWKTNRQIVRKNLRVKIAKMVSPKFIAFWDYCTDYDPKYCFLCGYYIPVGDREIYAEQPFKNGDLVHVGCFKQLMKIKHINDRIKSNSELICHMDLGWGIQVTPICRERVTNNPGGIRDHLLEKHGWKRIPKIEYEEMNSKERRTQLDYYKKNPEAWFNNNQIYWKDFRNAQFLKPNGKAFPRPRE